MAQSKNSFLSALASSVTSSGTVPSAALAPEVTSSIEGAGTAVYDSASLLPISGNTAGDTAFVKSTSRLYIHSGVGWYNVAVINNTPTVQSITDSDGGTTPFSLSIDGTPTTITITAQDSDGDPLTYNYSADSNFAGLATIGQDANVFTITPYSQDSATTSSGTITFSVTDGINTATPAAQTFKLVFGSSLADPTNISASKQTVMINPSSGPNGISDFAFAGPNTLYGCSFADGEVSKFDYSSGTATHIVSLETSTYVGGNAVSRVNYWDGYIVAAGWDDGIIIWDETNFTNGNHIYSTATTAAKFGYGYQWTMEKFILAKNFVPHRTGTSTTWNGYRWKGTNSMITDQNPTTIVSGGTSVSGNIYSFGYDDIYDKLIVFTSSQMRTYTCTAAEYPNGSTATGHGVQAYVDNGVVFSYDPTTHVAVVSSTSGMGLDTYVIASDGTITVGDTTSTSLSVAHVHAENGYLYVAQQATTLILVYQIGTDGSLTQLDFVSHGGQTAGLIGAMENPMGFRPETQEFYYAPSYNSTSNNFIKIT